ncbi:DNA excision repair protein ERCC-6-like isoform X2 [Cyprinodon tularosa]|uniref:DNA excision repair protein ERCC-6-like isoform X2 n=1 Tax=Cyprinodon tularosa TaxID=77115 RepID=UPI0018E1EEDE|nr:DNA excision repair protein ERCC-6-like isoform X2 [Cyprinodon tularosa]
MEGNHITEEMSEISERLQKSMSLDAEDDLENYRRLISKAKASAKQGDIEQALKLFKQAFNIHQTPKLENRIKKIEEILAENNLEDEDEFINVNNSGLMLFKELHDNLYDYQRDGVSFLYSLYRDRLKGGVLADDMGLGKTIQIISFLSGMYDNELIKHTLLVMPTSLITNWVREFGKWTPGMRVKAFYGSSKAERTRNLEKVQSRGGVIITSYTMLMSNWQQLASYRGKEFCWDYMILDEAHKIKNPSTKTAKSAYAIPSKNRILLTGTPVQNNLREMWTLFDFACQGSLLGTAKTFKTEYENPITRAREKDATPGEKALGSRISENLMTLIKPYFLRRTKSEVQKKKAGEKEANPESNNQEDNKNPPTSGAVMPELTRKNDLVVWTYLSAVQEDIYRQFIGLDHIKELLMTTRSPLAELTILKKLCDHPRLLSANAIAKLGLEENPEAENGEGDAHNIANVSDETLISESGKLVFLLALLEQLREEGHRTLVFAHYRVVLDILERILGNRGFKVLRLDGTITQITEREKLISRFQKDKRYSVFLLTTQVGGVGITLTAANRVVIYDPSWNPATDAQAVDRAYRIGQKENVVIYRLITCGTVEEKIYRRQVFKDSLIRQNTGDKKNPFRYFSRQELKELFTLEDPRSSTTQLQLQALHSRHRRTDPALDEHIAHLHAMHMFGISDHDLMFSQDVNHDEDPEDQEEYQYIQGRVQKAQELVKAESELQMQLVERMASSTEPAWLRQPLDHERKPRNFKPSPPPPDQNSNVVDLDQSSSGEELHQNQSIEIIDLSADASEEPMDGSGPEASLVQITADGCPDGPGRTSYSDSALKSTPPLQNRRVSDLQQSNSSLRAGSSRMSAQLESFNGNFNLELEDKDDGVQEADGEEEERKLLSQLQMDGSFNLDQSGSGGEELHQNQSLEIIDLSADASEEPMDRSGPGRTSHPDSALKSPPPLQNRRVSDLQQSDYSLRAGSSRMSAQLESFNGNFNLELEDTDDGVQEADGEEEERKLLSQLQMDGSFNVDKSLSERRWTADGCAESHVDESVARSVKESPNWSTVRPVDKSINKSVVRSVNESADESIVVTRRKKAAVIYDSDEEEEELRSSFQVLGSSTPKRSPSGGGNVSVVSRRSLLQSIIEDMEDQDVQEEDDDDENLLEMDSDPEETTGETLDTEEETEEEETEEEEGEESEAGSADGEDNGTGSAGDELQLEETTEEEEEMTG